MREARCIWGQGICELPLLLNFAMNLTLLERLTSIFCVGGVVFKRGETARSSVIGHSLFSEW